MTTNSYDELAIDHENGTQTFDPNGILFEFGSGNWKERGWRPALDPDSGAPLKSVLSGEPSFLLHTSEAEIPLTGEEITRFVCRGLSPDEYRKLHDAYGDIFDLHGDFYDPETGAAYQSAI